MNTRLAFRLAGFALASLLLAPTALAQGAEDELPTGDPLAEETEGTDGPVDDSNKVAGASDPTSIDVEAEDAREGSPYEKPGETYRFIGLRYRGIIVPKFMMNLFGDGGTTVYIDNIGPEFAIRKDAFEYILSLSWADYGMEPTPFKSKSDPDQGWEHVESELNIIYAMAEFLWSAEVSPEFAFNFGPSVGLGIVFGDLNRTQVYPGTGSTGDPETYVPCRGPNDPPNGYCDPDDPFPGDTEPSWANGGSKPIVFPWLALMTGVRFKPHQHFVGRIDLGFGTSGFFVGVGADYGL